MHGRILRLDRFPTWLLSLPFQRRLQSSYDLLPINFSNYLSFLFAPVAFLSSLVRATCELWLIDFFFVMGYRSLLQENKFIKTWPRTYIEAGHVLAIACDVTRSSSTVTRGTSFNALPHNVTTWQLIMGDRFAKQVVSTPCNTRSALQLNKSRTYTIQRLTRDKM